MGSTGEERRGSGSFEDCGSSEKPTRVLGVEEVLGVKLGGICYDRRWGQEFWSVEQGVRGTLWTGLR